MLHHTWEHSFHIVSTITLYCGRLFSERIVSSTKFTFDEFHIEVLNTSMCLEYLLHPLKLDSSSMIDHFTFPLLFDVRSVLSLS